MEQHGCEGPGAARGRLDEVWAAWQRDGEASAIPALDVLGRSLVLVGKEQVIGGPYSFHRLPPTTVFEHLRWAQYRMELRLRRHFSFRVGKEEIG